MIFVTTDLEYVKLVTSGVSPAGLTDLSWDLCFLETPQTFLRSSTLVSVGHRHILERFVDQELCP